MFHVLLGFIIIFLVSCSALNHEKHNYTGTWEIVHLRQMWMGCYQKGMSQRRYPPSIALSCDCYIDGIRENFKKERLNTTDKSESDSLILGKLAEECVQKFSASQGRT